MWYPRESYTLLQASYWLFIKQYVSNIFIPLLFVSFHLMKYMVLVLALLQTGYSGYPLGDEGKHFVILHSVLHTNESGCYVDVLCILVDSNPLADTTDNAPSYVTKLEWLTFYSGGFYSLLNLLFSCFLVSELQFKTVSEMDCNNC